VARSRAGVGRKALPLEHFSVSSISLFLRCPRQWQERYIYKTPGASNSSLIIGSAVHLALSRMLMGERPGDYFDEAVAEHEEKSTEIIWKDSPSASLDTAIRHVDDYMRLVAPYLGEILRTEHEFELTIGGVPIPCYGFIDLETERKIVDYKTTGYFNRKVTPNPEWKLQLKVYQLVTPKDAEIHVLTRSPKAPISTPSGSSDPLYLPAPSSVAQQQVEEYLRQMYFTIEDYWKRWGENPWPGNAVHSWAAKYCAVENCCHVDRMEE
jgi:hypothetical protein